eukprot:TRINITY_DN24642_c0_g2_i1.p1 TRINITY_DN24642_c0_g2~~TRINITY_DN24642_c0_g2_i1.p1  ORF type:complete len:302 (-),score=47.32 TRINITY_DN24642_c0_g2_i1:59-964(-)
MLRSLRRCCGRDVQHQLANQLHEALRSRTFRCEYDARFFGAFPVDRAFVEGVVDVTGAIAAFPVDPRHVPPVSSPDVVVEVCPDEHPLAGQLRCVARRPLEPGLTIPYAGELYEGQKDHDSYSADYSCSALGGMVVDGSRFCNEAAFVNHYYGIAIEPNCQLDNQGGTGGESLESRVVAAIRVIRPMVAGTELLVDYGLEYCLRNQLPHQAAEEWERDLAAFSLLMSIGKRLATLERRTAEELVRAAVRTELEALSANLEVEMTGVVLDWLSDAGRLQAEEPVMNHVHVTFNGISRVDFKR